MDRRPRTFNPEAKLSRCYLTDRRAVEALLLPRMMLRIVALLLDETRANPQEYDPRVPEILERISARFRQAIDEVRPRVAPAAWDRVYKRTVRTQAEALAELLGRPVTTAFLAIVTLAQDLVARDLLELREGSPFLTAYDELAAEIWASDENRAALEAADRSARKMARRLLAWFEAREMFRGPIAAV